MRRIDDYPNINDREKAISPWFRAGLVGVYHKGILLGLRWGTLTKDQTHNRWRYTNYQANEKGDIKVILIGYVPYENIETVNWDGDEYYGFPHIYCHCDTKRNEPYETLKFCEEQDFDGFLHYTEVDDYDSVRKFSKKCKTADSF